MLMRARVCLVAATLVAAGCGGGGDSPTSPAGNTAPPNTTVASVSINSSTTSVVVGASATLGASALNSSGTAVSAMFTWSSSNPAVATVGPSTGVVTGVAVGTTTITATASGISGTRSVSVTAAPVPQSSAQITMPGTAFAPSTVTLAQGGTITFVFTALAHNVFFGSGSGVQDIGVTQNASLTRTFNTKGSFSIVCTLHAGMSGTITVQ